MSRPPDALTHPRAAVADDVIVLADGRTFPVLAAGPPDGPLVIALHGFPQDRTAWRPVAAILADAGLRVLAPDLRGYASTVRPSGVDAYRVEHACADVIAIADAAGGDRFHVVGHDWGGAVAWHLAARHVDRLHTMTSVSTPHPAALGEAMRRSPSQAVRMSYAVGFALPVVPERVLLAGSGALLRRTLELGGLPSRQAEHYVERLREPGAMTAALNWYRAAVRHPVDQPAAARVPALLVWSTGDPVLRRTAVERTADHVEAPFELAVLEGVGHFIPEVAPERLAPLVLSHVRLHQPGE